MKKEEFRQLRKKLGRTQKQLAVLLGMSAKTIQFYENGRRAIPGYIQRNIFYLLIKQREKDNKLKPCWDQKDCRLKENCPAWEFQSGDLCWYLNGTFCRGHQDLTYQDKLEACRSCNIFKALVS